MFDHFFVVVFELFEANPKIVRAFGAHHLAKLAIRVKLTRIVHTILELARLV
jgi:hypothetical protein